MITITINDVRHGDVTCEVWADRVLWCPKGEFIPLDAPYADMVRALVLCDYEMREQPNGKEHLFVSGRRVHEHFIDTHDAEGNRVPGGRPSGIMFPIASKPLMRPTKVAFGRDNKTDGTAEDIIVVYEWDNPLLAVLTAREAEREYGLAGGSIKKMAREGSLRGVRKSAGTWLILRAAAAARWG